MDVVCYSTYEKLCSQRQKGEGFTAFDVTFTDGFVGSFKSKWTPKDTFKEKDYLSILMAVKIACKILKNSDLFSEVEFNMTTEKLDHLIEDTYQQSSDYMTIDEILQKHHVEYGNISAYDDYDIRELTFNKLAVVITSNNRAYIVGSHWLINCIDGEFIYFFDLTLKPRLSELPMQTCMRLKVKNIDACPSEQDIKNAMFGDKEQLLDWLDAFPSLLEREHFTKKRNIFHFAPSFDDCLEIFELIQDYIEDNYPLLPNMEFDADEDGFRPYMSLLGRFKEEFMCDHGDIVQCRLTAEMIKKYLESGVPTTVLATHWNLPVMPQYYDLFLTGLLEMCHQYNYTAVQKFLIKDVLQNSLLMQQKCYGTSLKYQYIDTARYLLKSYPDLYNLHMERDINPILRKRSAEKDHVSSTKKAK